MWPNFRDLLANGVSDIPVLLPGDEDVVSDSAKMINGDCGNGHELSA